MSEEKKNKKNFYQEVADNNEGIEAKNVKSIFIWYDLLSFALSFQLIFIFAYSVGIDFAATMLSALFIIITDTVLKITLSRDSKNYEKLKSQMALVKLWTIPLLVLGIATLVSLIIVTFGLI